MTGPDHLWLNLNHANKQRHGVSFVTKGPLAGPPYTQYVRADVVEQLAEALRTIATFVLMAVKSGTDPELTLALVWEHAKACVADFWPDAKIN